MTLSVLLDWCCLASVACPCRYSWIPFQASDTDTLCPDTDTIGKNTFEQNAPPRNLPSNYTWPIIYFFQVAWVFPRYPFEFRLLIEKGPATCQQPTLDPDRRNIHDVPFYARHPPSLSTSSATTATAFVPKWVEFNIWLTKTYRLRAIGIWPGSSARASWTQPSIESSSFLPAAWDSNSRWIGKAPTKKAGEETSIRIRKQTSHQGARLSYGYLRTQPVTWHHIRRRDYLPASVVNKGCNRIIVMKMWNVSNRYTPSEHMVADFMSSRKEGCLDSEIVIS